MADDIADIWKEGYELRKRKDAIKCMEWLNPVPDGSRNGGRLTRLLSVINETRSMLSPSKKGCTYLLGEEVRSGESDARSGAKRRSAAYYALSALHCSKPCC